MAFNYLADATKNPGTNLRQETNDKLLYYITSEDVTKLHADVLIIYGNPNPVTRHIFKKIEFEMELKKRIKNAQLIMSECPVSNTIPPYVRDGDFCVTSSFNSGYRHIIHVFLPMGITQKNSDTGTYRKLLQKLTRNVLNYADKELKAQSIVFASLSFPETKDDFVRKAMNAAVNTWIRTENPYMNAAVAVAAEKSSAGFRNVFYKEKEDDKTVQVSEYSDEYTKFRQKMNDEIKAYLDQNPQKSKQDFYMAVRIGYISQYTGKRDKLAETIGVDTSTISRYKSYVHNSRPQTKETALALGIALQLNPEDMYRFMISMEYEYPADERDYCIAGLISPGEYDFKTVTEKVHNMFPDMKGLVKEEKKPKAERGQ